MRPTARLLVVLLGLCALVLAACGGGDDDNGKRGYDRGYDRGYGGPISGTKAFALKPSLVASGFSPSGIKALTTSYKPTGKIVGDSGFRAQGDGFSFENYGNDGKPANLGPKNMVNLFGNAVCIPGSSGSDCQLTPVAQAWMENSNNGMAGGHCEGFSVTALRMFSGSLQASDYGSGSPSSLAIRGNSDLQSTIAEDFMYQALPEVKEHTLVGGPLALAKYLAKALPTGKELFTLGIYKPDFTGGHAITPIAVEQKANNQWAILVYDNNFPGATRAVKIDGNSNVWTYRGGTDPTDTNELYRGSTKTQTLQLEPLTSGLGKHPCPFCRSGNAAGSDTGKNGVLNEYAEVTMRGDPRNHPHLVFTDSQGRKTGVIHGKLITEIPEIEVVNIRATKTWSNAPEPTYRFPEGNAQYDIHVDGEDLDHRARPTINLITNGLVIEVSDITLDPGQVDDMALPKGYGVTYQANGKHGEEPNIFAGLVHEDASYQFAASAVGVKPGSIISLVVDQPDNVAYVDSTGGKGSLDDGSAVYILQLLKVNADGKHSIWQRNDVVLNGDKNEKAGFEYSKTAVPGKKLPFVILNGDNSVKKVVFGKPIKG